MAHKMVCEWGMSEKLVPLTFGKKEEQIFLGREIAQHRDYSESTAVEIDRSVRKFVMDGYNLAREILEEKDEALTRIAQALLERESLTADEIQMLARGETLPEIVPAETPVFDPAPEAKETPASDDSQTEDPGGLPQPGNQPA